MPLSRDTTKRVVSASEVGVKHGRSLTDGFDDTG